MRWRGGHEFGLTTFHSKAPNSNTKGSLPSNSGGFLACGDARRWLDDADFSYRRVPIKPFDNDLLPHILLQRKINVSLAPNELFFGLCEAGFVRLRQERSLLRTENILEKLFEHNNWANLQIIKACSALSDEQLEAEPHSATKGSIRSTLLHLVASQRGYLSLLTLSVESRSNTPIAYADLQDSSSISGEGLLALARDEQGKLPKTRLQTRDGYYVELWVVMLQVINHATEHREQIKSMLSALGVTPPEIDGWDYGQATNVLIPIPT